MKEKLLKLLTVKSIVTLILTVVFAYLSIIGIISAQDFMTIFTVVIAFYFGTQAEKKTVEPGIVVTETCANVPDCPYKDSGVTGGEVV